MERTVLIKPGSLVREASVQIPLLSPGHALIRVAWVGINGSDVLAFQGYQPNISYPRVLGMAAAGRIVSIDPPTKDLQVGADVLVNPFHSREGEPPVHQPVMEVLGVNVDGALQEYVCVPVEHLHFARGLSLDCLPIAIFLAVGAHALRSAPPKADVLVLGDGPVCFAAAVMAKAMGHQIAVLSPRPIPPANADLFKRLRIPTIAYSEDMEENIHATAHIFKGSLPQMTVLAAAPQPVLQLGAQLTRNEGTLVYCGCTRNKFQPLSLPSELLLKRSIKVIPSRLADGEDIECVLTALTENILRPEWVAGMVSHHCEFEDLQPSLEAWQVIENNFTMGLVRIADVI